MGYEIWHAKLRGENPPLHNDQPVEGYFRISRDGKDLPVAFWVSNGELLGEVDGEPCEPKKLWPAVLRGVWIAYEVYKFRADNGRWPDEPAPLAGHNNPPTEEAPAADPNPEYTRLTKMAEAVLTEAETLYKTGTPTEKEMADQMAALTMRMNAVALDAEAAFKVEKQPVLDEARRIDERWSFSKLLRERAKWIKEEVIAPILKRQKAREEAEAEARRKEAARIAEEHRRKAAEAEAANRPPPPPPIVPEPVEPARVTAGIGRKKLEIKDRDVVRIVDAKAFALYLIDKADPDLAAVLEKRANALLRAKATKDVPGLKVEQEAKL